MAANDDYIAQLGGVAIASRLRRLLHRLLSDGEKVYSDLNIDFKTRWFPIFHLLANRAPLFLNEIAQSLEIAHPSVIESVGELEKAGLVKSHQSDIDRRRRELSLSAKGKRLYDRLVPVWDAFRLAAESVVNEGKHNFLNSIRTVENALDEQSMYQRIMAQLKSQNRKRNIEKIGQ